jgi:hypothetical protein
MGERQRTHSSAPLVEQARSDVRRRFMRFVFAGSLREASFPDAAGRVGGDLGPLKAPEGLSLGGIG